MNFDEIARRGLVMLGCGKMGQAMLRAGWTRGQARCASGCSTRKPSDWLRASGVA